MSEDIAQLAMLDEDLRIRSAPAHNPNPEIPFEAIMTANEAFAKGLTLNDLFPTLFPGGAMPVTEAEIQELAELRGDTDELTEANTIANASSMAEEDRKRLINAGSDYEYDEDEDELDQEDDDDDVDDNDENDEDDGGDSFEDRYAGPDIGLPGDDTSDEDALDRNLDEKCTITNGHGDKDTNGNQDLQVENAFDESLEDETSSDESLEDENDFHTPTSTPLDIQKQISEDNDIATHGEDLSNNKTNSILVEEFGVEKSTVPLASPTEVSFAANKKPKRRFKAIVEDAKLDYNRCIMSLTQGDYEAARMKRPRAKRYLLASDLSEESSYALEWAIGTVIRDGDNLIIVNVIEDEDVANNPDLVMNDRVKALRTTVARRENAEKLINTAKELVEQTRLQVKITAESLHAAHATHMMLDIIDYLEPTLVIVGSRGVTGLKGMLLGSFAHYLVYKSSVPVMVARRKLKKAKRKHTIKGVIPKSTAPLSEARVD